MKLEFISTVSEKQKRKLEEAYKRFTSEYFVRILGPGIQTALKIWVENGNDPYVSNRYGFYDCRTHQYLDFLKGEAKLCQLLEIAAGTRNPAECNLNQFKEALPSASPRPLNGAEEIRKTVFSQNAALFLESMKHDLSSKTKTDKKTILEPFKIK